MNPMRASLFKLAAELADRGEAFALAVVVRRQPASSAQAGDMAIVTEAGAFHGWLGGSCTQPTVMQAAREVLADGKPRLLALSPDPAADQRQGIFVHPMTCHSGGTVEIYLEPILPPSRLVVFGLSPAARALARLGKAMGYAVEAVDPDAAPATFPEADRIITDLHAPELSRQYPRAAGLFAVVATLGQRDEESLLAALALEPAYVAVVASRRRFSEIRATIQSQGTPAASLQRVKNPAGLDIGATTPEEIALSILTEIVQQRRAAQPRPMTEEPKRDGAPAADTAVDPVCGMTVVIATARHRAEHGGRAWYFCNARCRDRFLAAPDRFGSLSVTGGAA
jgi:xanthine dehydrogenase accessory factor